MRLTACLLVLLLGLAAVAESAAPLKRTLTSITDGKRRAKVTKDGALRVAPTGRIEALVRGPVTAQLSGPLQAALSGPVKLDGPVEIAGTVPVAVQGEVPVTVAAPVTARLDGAATTLPGVPAGAFHASATGTNTLPQLRLASAPAGARVAITEISAGTSYGTPPAADAVPVVQLRSRALEAGQDPATCTLASPGTTSTLRVLAVPRDSTLQQRFDPPLVAEAGPGGTCVVLSSTTALSGTQTALAGSGFVLPG